MDYDALRLHIEQSSNGGHASAIGDIAGRHGRKNAYAYYCEAIATLKRAAVPSVGYSIDRRTFELTSMRYNDSNTRSLMCFICGQIKHQTSGRRSSIDMSHGTWLFGISASQDTADHLQR